MECSYSYLDTHYWVRSEHRQGSLTAASYTFAPQHTVSFRSNTNITQDLELDLWLHYVANLSGTDIPSYTGLDIQVARHPEGNLELALIAKDLLDPQHPEFQDEMLHLVDTEIPRSVYAKLTWHF